MIPKIILQLSATVKGLQTINCRFRISVLFA